MITFQILAQGRPAFNALAACRRRLACLALLAASAAPFVPSAAGQMIGSHRAVYDASGVLQPWTSWTDALQREVEWYLKCPIEKGYPRFVYTTFMNGEYQPNEKRPSLIPATQNGMGIISYLKYYTFTGRRDARLIQMARYMGDYLVTEALTPEDGKYPKFSRSTGWAARFPQPNDCGSQRDQPYEIQPDKGGIAGFALVRLFDETHDGRYLSQARQNARVLAANMIEGTAHSSPWPFRADYRSGVGRGPISGNMAFILRLFDQLIEHGYREFKPPREKLWTWIKTFQIPNLATDGSLWAQFFEDHNELTNLTAWAPLNLARYLLEKREAVDPDWAKDARSLIEFVNNRFVHLKDGIPSCGEQDKDQNPWGGIASTYGAVLAMFAKATGSPEYKGLAYQTLSWVLYAIHDDGCPSDGVWKEGGGWQEDAHTDKLHNLVDALNAFPEWRLTSPAEAQGKKAERP